MTNDRAVRADAMSAHFNQRQPETEAESPVENNNAKQREPHIAYGDLSAYREFISEMFGLAQIYAEQATVMANVADDAGLTYFARGTAAYVKAAVGALADMQAHKASDAKEAV